MKKTISLYNNKQRLKTVTLDSKPIDLDISLQSASELFDLISCQKFDVELTCEGFHSEENFPQGRVTISFDDGSEFNAEIKEGKLMFIGLSREQADKISSESNFLVKP